MVSRKRTVRARPRSRHAPTGRCSGKDAGSSRSRNRKSGVRRDEPSSQRQSAYRSGSLRPKLQALLRNPDRHRLGTGPDTGACAVDRSRLGQHLDARIGPGDSAAPQRMNGRLPRRRRTIAFGMKSRSATSIVWQAARQAVAAIFVPEGKRRGLRKGARP